ncbi:MAG: hypothetical protein KC620_19750 [Myxococcales bacterium]|nr:hypothetical protein [Myxococcales bacterium]
MNEAMVKAMRDALDAREQALIAAVRQGLDLDVVQAMLTRQGEALIEGCRTLVPDVARARPPRGCELVPSRPLVITVADDEMVEETWEAPEWPLVVEAVLLHTTDERGLAAFTVGYGPHNASTSLFYSPDDSTDTDNHPPAEHLFVSRLADLRPGVAYPWQGQVLKAGEKFIWRVTNLIGEPPYDVRITVLGRRA